MVGWDTVTFLQHTMLFFWNRYEVPALQSGAVSAENPRPAGMTSLRGPVVQQQRLVMPRSSLPSSWPPARPFAGTGELHSLTPP